jgi:hypothetical protein
MNRPRRTSTLQLVPKPTEKGVDRQAAERPLKLILLTILLSSIIAGALTFAAISLLCSKSTSSKEGRTSPPIVGTDHPVPANPPSPPATSSKYQSRNTMTTPVPQPSAVVEKDSGAEANSPRESMREKAEHARDEAERRRAHAEDLYQSHLISAEAYRKAQAEYQREMLKYQNQLAEYHRALNATGATNE